MDNLCHTLAGAAFGEDGLKSRSRFGNATLMIASNLPDLDVLVYATSSSAVAFRRGWTHGVLAQALLPVGLALIVAAVARCRPAAPGGPPLRVGWLLLLSYLGVTVHVLMDLLNTYGVRLLMPLDRRWFYGDALFIIDPWMWLMLGGGVWLARTRHAPRPARIAIAAAACYVLLMVASALAARQVVSTAWVARAGAAPHALMVGPVPVTPFRREVIVDAGDRYVTGAFTWLPLAVTFDAETVAKHDRDPRVVRTESAPAVRGFLVWARFPYWTFDPSPGGTRVSVRDMRVREQLQGRFAGSAIVTGH